MKIQPASNLPVIKMRTGIGSAFLLFLTACVALMPVAAPAAEIDAYPVSVTDATGRVLRFNRPPGRIVVIGAAPFVPLHMLFMYPEMRDLLVGYEQKTKNMGAFIELLDPDDEGPAALMSNPGIEEIAALNPDLVVCKGTVPGTWDKPLRDLGIPCLYLDTETPERFLADVDVIGRVLGNPGRAREIDGYYRQKLNLIAGEIAGIPEDRKPRTLMLEYSNRGGGTAVRVPAASWIQTLQVQETGGSPVWLEHAQLPHGWQIVGFEQIAAWDPDIIFMVVWHALDERRIMNQLASDDKWRRLKAVSTGRFHLIPQDILSWDTPDPRWILGMLWMAGKTYPKRFSAIDMKQEVHDFFQRVYGMDKAMINRHIVPNIHFYDGE